MIALWSWKGHKTRGEVIDIQSTEHNKGDIVCMQLTMDSDKKQPIQETTPDADQNQEEQPPTYEEAVLDDDVKRHMEEWKKVAQERPLRVMVCGLGGVGKSTLINRLLQLEEGEKWAEEGMTGGATTSVVTKFEKVTKSGIKICLFDTPGFGDIDITDEKIIAMMEKETDKKLDVFFYCISLEGAARIQQPDVTAIQRMTQAFSHEIWKKAVVVFTFANALEEKKKNADEYQMVIERIKEKIKETLGKQHIPEDIIKEVPMLTAGHADAILRYEAEECKLFGGWDSRLFLAALKQVDPAVLPALFEVRWSWKDLGAALGGGGGGAATGAGTGAVAGAVVGGVLGPVGIVTGAGVGALIGAGIGAASGAGLGVLAYQFVKIKSLLKIKYMKWQLNRKPKSPHQASQN
jgi:small GTP-binding protein